MLLKEKFYMTYVYTFKVQLVEFEDKIWRDIEITSASSVAKLAYSIIAAFGGDGSHLFGIRHNNNRYEFMPEDDFQFSSDPLIDPVKTNLSKLKLTVGDTLMMAYDYGAGWEFSIELISATEMNPHKGRLYPRVTAGAGNGIIENSFPSQLEELMEHTDKTGKTLHLYSEYGGEMIEEIDEAADPDDVFEIEWDYREFDLEDLSIFFQDLVQRTQHAYESGLSNK